MRTYTAGPWMLEEETDGTPYKMAASPVYQACIMGGDGAAIADIRRSDFRDSRTAEEAHANACLIASTPEMCRLLIAAYHALRSYQYGNSATEPAKDLADLIAAALKTVGVEVTP